MTNWVANGRTYAAGAIAAAALAVVVLTLGSGRGAAPPGAQLTVAAPPPTTDRVYGAPGAAGRPIVVIDAGHGGRDPGATGVSGDVSEKELALAVAS